MDKNQFVRQAQNSPMHMSPNVSPPQGAWPMTSMTMQNQSPPGLHGMSPQGHSPDSHGMSPQGQGISPLHHGANMSPSMGDMMMGPPSNSPPNMATVLSILMWAPSTWCPHPQDLSNKLLLDSQSLDNWWRRLIFVWMEEIWCSRCVSETVVQTPPLRVQAGTMSTAQTSVWSTTAGMCLQHGFPLDKAQTSLLWNDLLTPKARVK